jgi:hypothetical protein
MEPKPGQVKNHYSLNIQEAHIDRELAFKKAANVRCLSNVCLPISYLSASYCGRVISLIPLINQVHITDQEISDDDGEVIGESTISL